jgi:hypothetical protein
MYNVPSILSALYNEIRVLYEFQLLTSTFCARYSTLKKDARAEIQETRLIALCYEIRVVYEFPLLHSPIGVRHSILKRSEKQEARTEINAAPY